MGGSGLAAAGGVVSTLCNPRSASPLRGGMVGPLGTWFVALNPWRVGRRIQHDYRLSPSVFESLAETPRPEWQPVMDSFNGHAHILMLEVRRTRGARRVG